MRIRSATIEWGLARLTVFAAWGLFATVRRQFFLAEPELSPYQRPANRTAIYSVWHDSLLPPLFLGRQPATKALVGMHRDGTFLANSLAALGIPCVRGSSSNGGARALRQLIDETDGYHIVVTPDGPRGPRREMKPGIAYLASRTGKFVVPTAFACTRSWSWGAGWTDLMVPKPGSTIVALTGPGIEIPPRSNREQLAHYDDLIQQEMNRLNGLAEQWVASRKARTAPPPELQGFA